MNIESIKNRLLVKYPLFGSVVANSNFISEPSIGTAATDGKNIYYSPNFIESVTEDQQTFIFAHAICHIAFDHILRSEGRDGELWNIATDSVVNAFLKQDGLPMVDGTIDIPEAINYDAEEMYNRLLEEKNKQQQKNKQGNNNQSDQDSSNANEENMNNKSDQGSSNANEENMNNKSDQGSSNANEENMNNKSDQGSSSSKQNDNKGKQSKNYDVGHDTHSMWDKVIEKKNQEQQSQSDLEKTNEKDENKQSFFDKLSKKFNKKKEDKEKQQQFNDKQSQEYEKKINKEIERIKELGEKKAFKQNKIERKKQLEELREELVNQTQEYGSYTNSEIRNIDNIGISRQLIDWRRLLKDAIKYDIDWSYQNAGIEDGVVTAYLEEFPKPETEIVLDTSRSINEHLLRNFLRECKNILQTSKMKVGCFDTKFYGFAEIKDVSDIDSFPLYGGGGTDFDVAVNAFTKRVENKIIFTDGDAEMPSVPMDAIWVVFGEEKIKPLGGKVIYINEQQLERLYNYQVNDEENRRTR